MRLARVESPAAWLSKQARMKYCVRKGRCRTGSASLFVQKGKQQTVKSRVPQALTHLDVGLVGRGVGVGSQVVESIEHREVGREDDRGGLGEVPLLVERSASRVGVVGDEGLGKGDVVVACKGVGSLGADALTGGVEHEARAGVRAESSIHGSRCWNVRLWQ